MTSLNGFDPVISNQNQIWLITILSPLAITLVSRHMHVTANSTFLASFADSILFGLLSVCVFTDTFRRKIYNWCTYPAFIWGVVLNGYASIAYPNVGLSAFVFSEPTAVGPAYLGAIGLSQCLSGAAICFFVMLICYQLARGGAGDVKLATAIGALLGVRDGLLALAFGYICAAVVIVIWSIWARGPFALAKSLLRRIGSFFLPTLVLPPSGEQQTLLNKPVPLAAFLAVGTVTVLWRVQLL